MDRRLADLAQECYAKHGRSEEATRALLKAIGRDAELKECLLLQAAADLLRTACHNVREVLIRGHSAPQPGEQEFRDRVEQACKARLGMYDWAMMDGTKLQDATREHVLEDAMRYEAISDGNLHRARIMRSVAARMQPGQIVNQVLSEEELEAIKIKAKNKKEVKGRDTKEVQKRKAG